LADKILVLQQDWILLL